MRDQLDKPPNAENKENQEEVWERRLYIAGPTHRCITAFANLKKICEEHLAGNYHIEIIDLKKNPQLASRDKILAIPTLVRKLPEPTRELRGDLSYTERVLAGLGLSLYKSSQDTRGP